MLNDRVNPSHIAQISSKFYIYIEFGIPLIIDILKVVECIQLFVKDLDLFDQPPTCLTIHDITNIPIP